MYSARLEPRRGGGRTAFGLEPPPEDDASEVCDSDASEVGDGLIGRGVSKVFPISPPPPGSRHSGIPSYHRTDGTIREPKDAILLWHEEVRDTRGNTLSQVKLDTVVSTYSTY